MPWYCHQHGAHCIQPCSRPIHLWPTSWKIIYPYILPYPHETQPIHSSLYICMGKMDTSTLMQVVPCKWPLYSWLTNVDCLRFHLLRVECHKWLVESTDLHVGFLYNFINCIVVGRHCSHIHIIVGDPTVLMFTWPCTTIYIVGLTLL